MTFFFHYNKPHGKVSIHYQKKCHLVDGLLVRVPVHSKFNKRQPKFVMKGVASKITIENGLALVE